MSQVIPEEWVNILASDAFSLIATTDKKVKTKDCLDFGKFPVVDQGQGNVAGYVNDENKVITVDEPLIVFGDHTRTVKWINFSFVPGADGTKILQSKRFIEARLAYHQLCSLEIPDKGYSRHFKFFKELNFAIPPLAEQRVIADKLDELLAQVESTKARLDAIPAILKSFRQSVLAAAVSGKLTEEWRGENTQQSWENTLLGDIIIASANGLSKRSGKVGQDTTILRLADFKNAIRIFGKERQIKLNEKELEKYSLRSGDILVIRVNGSADLAGRFIEYRQNDCSEGFCDHFIRLRLDTEKVLPTYLTFVANEGVGRHYLQSSLSTSAGQNTINQGSVKGLKVPLPSVLEQAEIVRRVEELLAFADSIEQKATAALERVNNLTQSILARAFRGELTADWRAANPELISGENSAEALLAKIAAEREAIKKQPKPKRTAIKNKTGSRMSKQIIKVVDALKEAGEPLSGQQLLAAAGYPSDSDTDQLEQFFLDIRQELIVEKSIVKLERGDDGQDWFTLAQKAAKE
ncbi:hypothetical protein GNT65_14925 [Shewanella sp. JBTF-M18]|uniref:Type I restriction modification DNA specificity domain-containing protein n=1 Tax=Shewanella insulae TaxID=2681496 RepID=A0A6L7I1Z7_9GAMM|nr:restriction endonuclease subunit S [Shewanella insulae]MXR69954.1 hypothetical protein [Shewanella insulae]